MAEIDEAKKTLSFVGRAAESHYQWLLSGPLSSWRGFLAYLITGGSFAVLVLACFGGYYLTLDRTPRFQEFKIECPERPAR